MSISPTSAWRGGQERRGIKAYYGFAKPYDFTRATPFLAAILLLLVVIGVAATAAASGKVHWGTFRFIYFVYLGSLTVMAAAASFVPRLAWPLLALCFFELSIGVGTAQIHLFKKSMLPLDNTKHEFMFHPLLQGVPTPNYFVASPVSIQHDSHGLRGAERDANRMRQQTVIAAVGGSTTYDVGVDQGQTWPEVLERRLGGDYAVLNHGVPAYSTVEHLIQTAFYLDAYDVTPRCAIYYVGWNDIANAHLPILDPGFVGFYHRSKTTALDARRKPLAADVSPVAGIVVSYLQLWLDTVRAAKYPAGWSPGQGSDSRLETLFHRNLEAIATINRTRGINSIFVGQVLNRAKLQDTNTHIWWPLVRNIDLWPLQARFNAVLREAADATGSPAYLPAVDSYQDSDFVDNGHFSAEGSAKFATELAPFIRANCKKD
jgi:lysophospholipase L1-like esterase